MIYFCGSEQLYKSEIWVKSSIKDCLEYLKDKEFVSFDTETTGFCPYRSTLLTTQFGDGINQYVIDNSVYDVSLFKELLESKTIIGQNLKFDLKFLYRNGIVPNKIYDTFIVECCLNRGRPEVRKRLDFIVQRYTGKTDVDKGERGTIHRLGLVDSVIKYCAKDVEYLEQIMWEQLKVVKDLELEQYIKLENKFVLSLAYIEYCGFKLDTDRWTRKIVLDKENYNTAREVLNSWVIDNKIHKFVNFQGDLFNPDVFNCSINWASSKQVIELFKELDIKVTVEKDGEIKESVQAKNINALKHPFVSLYLDYKQKEKVISSFGENILKQVNPVTGRIHTNFKQILETGRTSSGGKNGKESYINLQQIPRDKETRSCWIANSGNVLVIADYTAQEKVVLANQSQDASLIEFFNIGGGDIHSFTASKMYDLPIQEIKTKYKEQRYLAKTASFAIDYGGNDFTISQNTGLSVEKSKEVYDAYFKAFSELKGYSDSIRKNAVKQDYVLINNVLNARTWYTNIFNEYKELETQFTQDFWVEYRIEKEKESKKYEQLKVPVSRYFRLRGEMERINLNYKIQGTSGEISKLGSILFFEYLRQNDLIFKVLMCNYVHDEIISECSEELKDIIAENLTRTMEEAGNYYCKTVLLKAESSVGLNWNDK